MGATGWQYYVRYQEDVSVDLHKLRQKVFEKGEYEASMSEDDIVAAAAHLSPKLKKLYELAERWERNEPHKKNKTASPRTIEELVEQCEESGTHSILDIDHISERLEFGALTPLSNQQLVEIFGTSKPTGADVMKWTGRVQSISEPRLYERWEGIYFTVFKDGLPDELYIEGASGD